MHRRADQGGHADSEGGAHGRRSAKVTPGQMSLFESVQTPEKLRAAGGGRALGAVRAAKRPPKADRAAPSSRRTAHAGLPGSKDAACAGDGAFGWQRALELGGAGPC